MVALYGSGHPLLHHRTVWAGEWRVTKHAPSPTSMRYAPAFSLSMYILRNLLTFGATTNAQ